MVWLINCLTKRDVSLLLYAPTRVFFLSVFLSKLPTEKHTTVLLLFGINKCACSAWKTHPLLERTLLTRRGHWCSIPRADPTFKSVFSILVKKGDLFVSFVLFLKSELSRGCCLLLVLKQWNMGSSDRVLSCVCWALETKDGTVGWNSIGLLYNWFLFSVTHCP